MMTQAETKRNMLAAHGNVSAATSPAYLFFNRKGDAEAGIATESIAWQVVMHAA